jgi:hypothetical protein
MAGARVVAEAAEVPAGELHRPPRGERGGRHLVHHALVTDFRIWLREGCAASAGLFGYEFIPGYEEVRDGPRRSRRIAVGLSGGRYLIPDGVFSLVRRDGRTALFTLEVDRGTEPLTGSHENAVARKLLRYREAFEAGADRAYSQLLARAFSGFRILCLVPGEQRQGAFLRLAEQAHMQPLVWVAPLEIVRSTGHLDDPVWRERRGGELLPLSL